MRNSDRNNGDNAKSHIESHTCDSTRKSLYGPYLVVGSGRLSRHLQYYFSQLQIPYITWNRSESVDKLRQLLDQQPTVLLAISDQALSDFFEVHLKQRGLQVVHFSGAYHHSQMLSCHPLMTFTEKLFPFEFYKHIHWAVTGASSLQDIVPELPNPSFILQDTHKAAYHAWCVLSAAGAQTLWKSALQELRKMGVSEDAYLVYVKQITENFLNSPENSLTGPWVRNDRSTIQKNLGALPPAAAEIYTRLMKGLI